MDRDLGGNNQCGGLRLKKGLWLTMGLAVFVFSLYQIKEYSGNHDLQRSNHKVEEDRAMAFARKWKVGLTEGGDPETENGDGGVEGGEKEGEVLRLLHGFRDQNGIPPGGFELVNWVPYELREHENGQASDYSQSQEEKMKL